MLKKKLNNGKQARINLLLKQVYLNQGGNETFGDMFKFINKEKENLKLYFGVDKIYLNWPFINNWGGDIDYIDVFIKF